MKHIYNFIISLSLLLILMGCGGNRPPRFNTTLPDNPASVKSDNPTSTKQEPQSLNSKRHSLSPSLSEATLIDVEIPAPLSGRSEIILKRVGYTVSYNPELKIPNWVAWHLTAERLTGAASRKNAKFSEDNDVPEPRVTTYDYVNSGYDRGHMCPAADNKWNEQAMEESFLMTNICPQNGSLNRGGWNSLEIQCREWAEQYGDIYIVAGPILYKGKHKRIGENKVVVPEAFFKVVLCLVGEPKAIGFIYKNAKSKGDKADYVNTVDQVERITGIDFFPALPDSIEVRVEALSDYDIW